jgi:hypothetical protein
VRFILRGEELELNSEEVLKVKGYKGNEFNRLDFTTIDARSILKRLGFRCGEV